LSATARNPTVTIGSGIATVSFSGFAPGFVGLYQVNAPKKQDSLTTLLQEEIAKICPADREKRTWKELVVRATLQLAMKGNATALKEIWARLDGKPLQTGKLQLGGVDGKEVLIKVVYGDQENGSSSD
jgi:hypothetical protein